MHLIAATTSILFQGQHISCIAGTSATLFPVLQFALTIIKDYCPCNNTLKAWDHSPVSDVGGGAQL